MKEINDIKSLFNEDLMISDLYEWLDDTPLMKKILEMHRLFQD